MIDLESEPVPSPIKTATTFLNLFTSPSKANPRSCSRFNASEVSEQVTQIDVEVEQDVLEGEEKSGSM